MTTTTTNTNEPLSERLDQLQAAQERMSEQLEATIKALMREELKNRYEAFSGLQLYTEIADSLKDNGIDCPEYFNLPTSTVNLIETKSFLLEELVVQLSRLVEQLDVIKANVKYREHAHAVYNVEAAKEIVFDAIVPIVCDLGVRPCVHTTKY